MEEEERKGWKDYVRGFFTYLFVMVALLASVQFYYGEVDVHHILNRSAVVALALTAFTFIKDKTEDVVPYILLYFVVLLVASYLLLTNNPEMQAFLEWLLGSSVKETLLSPTSPTYPLPENYEIGLAIHREINKVREEHGLSPLTWDRNLAYIAYTYAKEMAENGFFSHYHDGQGPLDRYRAYDYHCKKAAYMEEAGENLFKGDHIENEEELAAFVVDKWMNSEGHRANILSEEWEREGIGVYVKNNTVYVVENFC